MASSTLLAGSFRVVNGTQAVLGFLPPDGGRKAPSQDHHQQLQSWLAPAEWAAGRLLSPELTESLCAAVERLLAGDVRAKNRACTVVDDGRIEVKALTPNILEIRIQESETELAITLCRGAIEHVQRSIQIESQALELETGMASRVQAGLEKVSDCEERLAKGDLANSVALDYGLTHYAEAMAEWRASRLRQSTWQSFVQSRAPSMVNLSGPQVTYGWNWKRWLVFALSSCLAVLFWVWRRPSRSAP